MRIFTLFLGILLLTFTSCGTVATTSEPKAETKSVLYGKWKLQNENQNETGMAEEPLTLSFDIDEKGKITGFAGCNYYGGNYSMNDSALSFSEIYATRRACPDLDIESQYLALLNDVNYFEIKGNNLYLYQEKILLLHFKK